MMEKWEWKTEILGMKLVWIEMKINSEENLIFGRKNRYQ